MELRAPADRAAAAAAAPAHRAAEARGASRLAAGFAALVALTFCLIVLGAMVRAHEAGLACPDWPLCFGTLVPRMNVRVAFEYSHRLLAGTVALLFAALAVATFLRRPPARAARRWVALAAVLLGTQILLGALTVWRLLASWTVTAHLVTGNAFAATLLLAAASLRDEAEPAPPGPRASRAAQGAIALAAALLVAQVVLGGLVSSRYAGLACSEWPTCNGGVWFPTWSGAVGVHLLHRWNAAALLAALFTAAFAARGAGHYGLLALLAAGLGTAQAAAGVANVLLGIPVEVTGLHSALAAALVLTVTLATREAWRGPASPVGGC